MREGAGAMRLSFLTMPLAPWERFTKDCERRFNYIKYTLRGNAYKAWTCTFPLGGHQDLVASFIKGAARFDEVELLINPRKRDLRGTVVYIPGSWRALREVLPLRRAGVIDRLIAGPLICFRHVYEHDGIIGSDAIDCYIVASQWVKEAYEKEAASCGMRIANLQVCPAGVDASLWSPRDMKEDKSSLKRALVYVKGEGRRALDGAADALDRLGVERRELFSGSHVPRDYKNMLEWCDVVVVLGGSETQGLALTQAWSMNRPTLVFESPEVGGGDATLRLTLPSLRAANGVTRANCRNVLPL